MGGIIRAKKIFKANIIGSESWVPTKVYVGDIIEMKKKMRVIHQSMLKNKSLLKEAKQIASMLQKHQETSPLSESQTVQLDQALTEIPYYEEEIEYEQEQEDSIKEEIETRKDAKLEVMKTLFPGSDLHIFDGLLTPGDPEQHTGFQCKNGLIIKYQI